MEPDLEIISHSARTAAGVDEYVELLDSYIGSMPDLRLTPSPGTS